MEPLVATTTYDPYSSCVMVSLVSYYLRKKPVSQVCVALHFCPWPREGAITTVNKMTNFKRAD